MVGLFAPSYTLVRANGRFVREFSLIATIFLREVRKLTPTTGLDYTQLVPREGQIVTHALLSLVPSLY
jgi:hypothetical protein